jgi:hypothetical protein
MHFLVVLAVVVLTVALVAQEVLEHQDKEVLAVMVRVIQMEAVAVAVLVVQEIIIAHRLLI